MNADSPNKARLDALLSIARKQFGETDIEYDLQILPGDAGFRRYYRLRSEPSIMLVDAPPEHEDCISFVQIDLLLREQGVHVPEVLAVDYKNGYMLLEDLGEQQYQQVLNPSSQERLYSAALDALLKIQSIGDKPCWMFEYSGEKLEQEMQLFPRWFVHELLQVSLSDNAQTLLEKGFKLLQESALEQSRVVVHRDYHVRNLMYNAKPPGVIDFQDAVWGPVTYDLVSLLRDCYVRWPVEKLEQTLADYQAQLEQQKIIQPVSSAQFRQWFDLMGLQRHIKVLGIFSRLALRDNKHQYLEDLPLVIRYTLEVAQRYPQLQEFADWFERELVPLAEGHSWYRDWRTAGDEHAEIFSG